MVALVALVCSHFTLTVPIFPYLCHCPVLTSGLDALPAFPSHGAFGGQSSRSQDRFPLLCYCFDLVFDLANRCGDLYLPLVQLMPYRRIVGHPLGRSHPLRDLPGLFRLH